MSNQDTNPAENQENITAHIVERRATVCVVFGISSLVLGLSDYLLTLATGEDFGLAMFWYRFGAQLIGLGLVGYGMWTIMPDSWRHLFIVSMAAFSVWALLSPTYYVTFYGPLQDTGIKPIEMFIGVPKGKHWSPRQRSYGLG